ncbi:hypothetical protein OQA88_11283 [Cercophora sp. LCS_1]
MRSVWSCSTCAVLLLAAVLGRRAEAAHARPKMDLLHRVAKAQITPGPLVRKDATCPTDHSACPETLGGGCCPSRYECATDSCYATTAGITSACGKEGYFACGAADSGGCCPVGYLCGPADCAAPAGVTNTIRSCPFNYYLCPASVNFGCCMNGMGCAPNACYSTSPVTSTVLSVITTTSNGQTITSTQTAITVATPTPPSGLPTDMNYAPKFIPTAVAKTSATSSNTPEPAAVGLTSTQVGGIVGGVVALLLIVVTAAWLIIRRLNRVQEAVESKSRTSSGQTKTQSGATPATDHPNGYGYVDETSIDPLMVTPGAVTPTNRRGRAGSKDTFSPSRSGFSPDGRHPSMDSAGGYFDMPPRVHNMPGGRQSAMTAAGFRSSVDSHSTQGYNNYVYHHQRQQSNASELSDGSEAAPGVTSPLVFAELDSSGAFVELPGDASPRSSLGMAPGPGRSRASSATGTALGSPRASFSFAGAMGAVTGRRRSESGGASGLRETSPPPPSGAGAGQFGPLDVVNESAEIMHGFYGPRDRQVGQTAAGLADVPWDVSSPVVVQFIQQPLTPGSAASPGSTPSEQNQQQQQQPSPPGPLPPPGQ